MTAPAMTVLACAAGQHDTLHAYRRHHCRCPDAIAARQAKRAEYRATLPRGSRTWRTHRDVDEVVVDLAIRGERTASGERPQLGVAERRMAIAELTRRGASAPQIARLLDVAPRTVQRARRHTQEEAA